MADRLTNPGAYIPLPEPEPLAIHPYPGPQAAFYVEPGALEMTDELRQALSRPGGIVVMDAGTLTKAHNSVSPTVAAAHIVGCSGCGCGCPEFETVWGEGPKER